MTSQNIKNIKIWDVCSIGPEQPRNSLGTASEQRSARSSEKSWSILTPRPQLSIDRFYRLWNPYYYHPKERKCREAKLKVEVCLSKDISSRGCNKRSEVNRCFQTDTLQRDLPSNQNLSCNEIQSTLINNLSTWLWHGRIRVSLISYINLLSNAWLASLLPGSDSATSSVGCEPIILTGGVGSSGINFISFTIVFGL